jgi:hypothetical protein
MHGPKPRSHAFKLQKKVRRLGLKIALSARTAEGKVSATSLNQCVFLMILFLVSSCLTPTYIFVLQNVFLYLIMEPGLVVQFRLVDQHCCAISQAVDQHVTGRCPRNCFAIFYAF